MTHLQSGNSGNGADAVSECSPKLECVRVARIDGRSLNMIVGGPVFTLADDPILYADVDGVTIHGCPANLVRAGQFYAVEWFNRTGDTDPDGYPIYWRVLAPKCRLEQRLGGEWRLTPKPISSAHLARILGVDKSMVPGRAARVGLEARAGEPYGGSQHAPKDGLRQDVPGSWKA